MGRLCAVVLAFLALPACANMNSISRTRFTTTSGALVHYADAKQWGVLSTRVVAGQPAYRSCAQPPPDAFSVLAYSLAGAVSGSLNPLPDGDEKALQAEIAQSLSESGSTIQRTQTVNLLRESMYRTCERYMNGAIKEEQFVVQAARDQRAMIAILAIEQLTGVVMPQPTILVANASATSSGRHLELLERYEAYRKRLDNANSDVSAQETAAGAYSRAQSGKCDTILGGVEPTDEPALTHWKECNTLKDTLVAAGDPAALKAAQSAAQTDVDNFQLILKGGPGGQSATSNAGGMPGDGIDPASPSERATIAATVQKITELAFDNQGELTLACLAVLGQGETNSNKGLYTSCVGLISNEVKLQSSKIGSMMLSQQIEMDERFFREFSTAVLKNGVVDGKRLEEVIASVEAGCSKCLLASERSSLVAAKNATDLKMAWSPLEDEMKEKLANAARD